MEDILTTRRQQSEDRFNELNKQKTQKEEEINEIVQELVKIQGEARVLDELIDKYKAIQNTEAPLINVSPEADTLNITEGENASNSVD